MDANQVIPEGALLRLEDSEYEDYRLFGFFRVLRSFVPEEWVVAHATEYRNRVYHIVKPAEYVKNLLSMGYIEFIPHFYVNISRNGYDDEMTRGFQEEPNV